MKHSWLASASADPATVQPTGDFVLIKPLPNPLEKLWLPETVRRGMSPLKRGRVVAAGPGDKLLTLQCRACNAVRTRIAALEWLHSDHLRGPVQLGRCACGCGSCEVVSADERTEMQTRPGDEVLYWRAPANDVRINGEEYVFLHEEQHIVAVLEASC